MKRFAGAASLFAAASLMLPLAAHALSFRTYLASYGNDGNPCTVAAPCRLIPAALAQVLDGGEIWMLDSANFNGGTVVINKSVSILAIPGQIGSIAAVGSVPAIVVSPGMTVLLRNVSIATNANNPGTDGIQMTTGSLVVEDSAFGIGGAARAIDLTGLGSLAVTNVSFHDGTQGIHVAGGGTATIANSTFLNLTDVAVYADGSVASTTTEVSVSNCRFGSVNIGALASSAGGALRLFVTGSSFSGGMYGIGSQVTAGSPVVVTTVGTSSIFNMSIAGMFQAGTAVLETQNNNLVRGNALNSSGTLALSGSL
ncbi:MAG TPA: right-handed parallel beta-helix repeat-containing protein [Usitatibacter sp.]|jgi:hypothetical protein|nr:right-handed parallel beta-helix repeat-containing protein [Usitatibacter sp.]